jgi:hypothetical protein
MDIFLSSSGQRSKMVAEALRHWLPGVLQSIDPWASAADIEAGARWHQKLSLQLNQCSFGVICVTPENLGSSWLLYEAGALSKAVEGSSVVPYLLGLRKVDVDGPLSHFQSVEADAQGTYLLLEAVNEVLRRVSERPLDKDTLRRTFDLWWPRLEEALQSALATPVSSSPPAARSSEQLIQELVENTRGIAGAVATLANRLEVEHDVLLQAARTVLAKILDDILPTLPANGVMEAEVERWLSALNSPKSTLEILNEAVKGAKSLRGYLGR